MRDGRGRGVELELQFFTGFTFFQIKETDRQTVRHRQTVRQTCMAADGRLGERESKKRVFYAQSTKGALRGRE